MVASDLSVLDGGITPIKIEPSANINEVLTTDVNGDVTWAPAGLAMIIKLRQRYHTTVQCHYLPQRILKRQSMNSRRPIPMTRPLPRYLTTVPYHCLQHRYTAAIDELAAATAADDQTAAEVPYDGTTSLLTATDTQAAIDELAAADSDDQTAAEVPYDGTVSLLAATDTQAAIDELAAATAADDQTAAEVPMTAPRHYLQQPIRRRRLTNLQRPEILMTRPLRRSSTTIPHPRLPQPIRRRNRRTCGCRFRRPNRSRSSL